MTSIEIKGLDSLSRKLQPEMLNKPMRDFLTKTAIVVQRKARDRAPVDTGRLAGSIATQVDSSAFPTWAKVGPMGKVGGETSIYGRILDESARYHYRGGKAMGLPSMRAMAQGKTRGGVDIGARMGSQTQGWFSKVPELVRASVRDLLREMGSTIRREFER